MKTIVLRQNILAVIFVMWCTLFLGCNKPPADERHINVIFRFDDYSALSSTDLELKIIDIFRKNKASVTFGVIPFDRRRNRLNDS